MRKFELQITNHSCHGSADVYRHRSHSPTGNNCNSTGNDVISGASQHSTAEFIEWMDTTSLIFWTLAPGQWKDGMASEVLQ